MFKLWESNNEQIYNPKDTKFLEEAEALKWAKERTDKIEKACQSMPTYKVVKKEIESVCYDQRKTPFGAIRKGYVYNFGWIIKTRKGYGVGHWLRITRKINQIGKF